MSTSKETTTPLIKGYYALIRANSINQDKVVILYGKENDVNVFCERLENYTDHTVFTIDIYGNFECRKDDMYSLVGDGGGTTFMVIKVNKKLYDFHKIYKFLCQ